MAKQLTITILQLDIAWGDPYENIRHAEALIASAPPSDLYVLPEMWSTGFATDPYDIAEPESESVSLRWMTDIANRLHCAISGSLAISVPPLFYNRHYFVDGRAGELQHYDKHHLFSYGHEDRFYTSGDSRIIVSFGGFRFLLATCYDLRFPLWSRYADDLQYDAIIVVANWPDSRQNAWQILTRARAIENQSYLIACNRVGSDDCCHYRGLSAVIDPIGKTVVSCPSYKESYATAILDLERLGHQRDKFRVLDDRDRFRLE